MDFEAQGTVRLILLMFAGAVFAGAGLWLLMRPKPTGTAAKIELFGLKFESSSAGVLVFLIGAVFLSLPLFVPEKAVVVLPPGKNTGPVSVVKAGEQVGPLSPASGLAALMLPPDPEVRESEPNDRVQIANQIGLGQTVAGEVRKGNDDWFVVAVPEGPAYVDLRVRKVGGGNFSARLLNAREESIDFTVIYHIEALYIRGEVPGNDRFYVLLWTNPTYGTTGNYEIAVLPVAD